MFYETTITLFYKLAVIGNDMLFDGLFWIHLQNNVLFKAKGHITPQSMLFF